MELNNIDNDLEVLRQSVAPTLYAFLIASLTPEKVSA
jgi:hypothetical protein